jgi:hypothetical protein
MAWRRSRRVRSAHRRRLQLRRRHHPEETKDWDIIWDDRGRFAEPHTGREIGLGTLAVREYLADLREPEIAPARIADAYVNTFGPAGRYHGVLFIEKEGFEPIFKAVRLYERYDLAPMGDQRCDQEL